VDTYIERLAYLCSHETLAAEYRGIQEGAERVASMIELAGGRPRLIAYGDTAYVVTRIQGASARTLGFYNHFDTYPTEPHSAWDTPPFELSRREDYLFARGACDNKGNIIARLAAIEAWQAIRGELPVSILLFQDAEEEIGSPTLGSFIQNHEDMLRADSWIWEAGSKDGNDRLEVFLGAHGILYVDLEVVTAAEDLHGSYAGSFPNAIWRLVWALNTIMDSQGNILIPEFYESVQEASLEARDLLNNLPVDLDLLRSTLKIMDWPGSLAKDRLKVLEQQYIAPFASIIGIAGGHQADGVGIILPHRANARLAFFLVPNQKPDEILTLLRSYLDAEGFQDVQIKTEATLPPSWTQPASGIVRRMAESIDRVYDKPGVFYPSMRGISPMGYITDLYGVPVIGTGVGHLHSRIHQPNENIRIRDFVENIKLMTALIDSLGNSEQDWD
jgi:acetylornithine deacetylase/succinyl-diaminopimelate desuccinylase-like protein